MEWRAGRLMEWELMVDGGSVLKKRQALTGSDGLGTVALGVPDGPKRVFRHPKNNFWFG